MKVVHHPEDVSKGHTFSPRTTPLVEAISRNYAAALQERFAKGSAFLKRLRFDTDSNQTLVYREVDPTTHEILETCFEDQMAVAMAGLRSRHCSGSGSPWARSA